MAIVPLSAAVREIIVAMPRMTGGLVFPGQDAKPFGNWSKSKAALDEASCVRGWWLHDLRRTAATNFQALGVRLEVNESVLNHVSGSRGGIAGIYQRYKWEVEKSLALQAWSERVLDIVARESRRTAIGQACDGPQA